MYIKQKRTIFNAKKLCTCNIFPPQRTDYYNDKLTFNFQITIVIYIALLIHYDVVNRLNLIILAAGKHCKMKLVKTEKEMIFGLPRSCFLEMHFNRRPLVNDMYGLIAAQCLLAHLQ